MRQELEPCILLDHSLVTPLSKPAVPTLRRIQIIRQRKCSVLYLFISISLQWWWLVEAGAGVLRSPQSQSSHSTLPPAQSVKGASEWRGWVSTHSLSLRAAYQTPSPACDWPCPAQSVRTADRPGPAPDMGALITADFPLPAEWLVEPSTAAVATPKPRNW